MLNKVPKGRLILMGGGEDRGDGNEVGIEGKNLDFKPKEILRALLPENTRRPVIEVITTASSVPDEVNEMYWKFFSDIGFKKVGFINMGTHPDTRNPRFIARIKKSHCVLFSGGDQLRLAIILGNTDVLAAIQKKYINDPHFTVAGSSAGAMALPCIMMFEGENNEAILKGTVKISSGLGFIDSCVTDTHFVKRGRFGRLVQAVLMNPRCVGVGLGEDTALVIKKGREAKCIGSGMVVIIDGESVGHTNLAYVENNHPICIEGIKVHILCNGNLFLLDERKFMPRVKDLKEIKKIKEKSKKRTKSKS